MLDALPGRAGQDDVGRAGDGDQPALVADPHRLPGARLRGRRAVGREVAGTGRELDLPAPLVAAADVAERGADAAREALAGDHALPRSAHADKAQLGLRGCVEASLGHVPVEVALHLEAGDLDLDVAAEA